MASIREDLSTGRRLYVFVAYGEPVGDRLKSLGMHYDRERHDAGQKGLYWISPRKRAEVEALLVEADRKVEAGEEPAQKPQDVSDRRVYAQVEYKGRRYYVIAEQLGIEQLPLRCQLTTLDGLTPFWVDCSACNLVRTYEGREKWDGRRYSGRTITVYPTIGSLREFRDRQKDPERARGQCTECGSWGARGQACRDCGGEGIHV